MTRIVTWAREHPFKTGIYLMTGVWLAWLMIGILAGSAKILVLCAVFTSIMILIVAMILISIGISDF